MTIPTKRKRGQRDWTREHRLALSAAMRARKPWLRSTGPKTLAGKKISSKNALKHGLRSRQTLLFRRLLRLQRAFQKSYLRYHDAYCSQITKNRIEKSRYRENGQRTSDRFFPKGFYEHSG